MKPRSMSLVITTPLEILFSADDVRSFRARDDSGAFGILPGHADFLTAIPACVARWTDLGGRERFCTLRGGLLTVTGGAGIRVACREAVLGDDLQELEKIIARKREAEFVATSRARVTETKLHAKAVRQIMRRLAGRSVSETEMRLEDLLR